MIYLILEYNSHFQVLSAILFKNLYVLKAIKLGLYFQVLMGLNFSLNIVIIINNSITVLENFNRFILIVKPKLPRTVSSVANLH